MGSTGEANDQDMLAPDLLPLHPTHTSLLRWRKTLPLPWLLAVAVMRLQVGDLHAVG